MCVVSSLVLDAEREKMAQNKSYDLKKSSRWRCRNFRQFTPVAFYFAALSAYRSVLLFGYWQRYAKYLEIPSVLPIFAPTHSDVVIAHYNHCMVVCSPRG